MKFITEGDLRDLYKKEPFTAYNLISEERLTPGARQFLADHKIQMVNPDSGNKEKMMNIKPSAEIPDCEDNWRNYKLYSKLKSIEALFLLTGEELLSRDVCLAESMLKLNKQFSTLKNAVKNKCAVENYGCSECAGINENNFSDNLDDCFEITVFHMQLEKRREILILHRLRCALQDIEPLALELSFSKEDKLFKDLIGKVNQIINSISQLICTLVGGGKCLKQS